MNTLYQPKPVFQDNSQYRIRPVTAQDDHALGELISIPMTTRGIKISFQRQPSYFQASNLIYETKDYIFIEDMTSRKLVACCSNGYRTCYVNGKPQPVRYSSDLRVNPQQRGKQMVGMLMRRVQETMSNPDFSQMVIFNDNLAAKAAVQNSALGSTAYHDDCLVQTLTLTGFKTPVLPASERSESQSVADFTVQATASHVPDMNHFIQEMAEFYNFIPAYDFKQLLAKHPYFLGLDISDFYLFYKNHRLVGMFGVWHQSQFKQTKIVDYGRTVSYLRGFYNLWARWTGHMPLPKKGETIKYHVLHSLLCKPDQLHLHDAMLRLAMKISRQRGIGRIAFTLAVNDPRQRLNQYYKGESLTGMHGFFCFNGNPRLTLDDKRITYLECGRI